MKYSRLSILLATIVLFLSACQKTSPDELGVTAVQQTSGYRLMTPAYYRESADKDAIEVRFYESPRIFELSKDNASYNAVKKMLDENQISQTPLRIYVGNELAPFAAIVNVTPASDDEKLQAANAKKVAPDFIAVKSVVPNMETLDSIFAYCKAQGCATGTATIDYCIPFQYVVDGCYARAHKMRQIMENTFGYSCEKVFSYEGPTGYLAVDAGDCCVFWWYHVAPLVSVKVEVGPKHYLIKKYVMDPSMFDEPVTIETWTSAQENLGCSPYADFGYTDITRGYIYAPGGYTDNYYYSTNWTLQAYADLETCN